MPMTAYSLINHGIMKSLLPLILCFSFQVVSAQKQIEFTYTPFIQETSVTNNINEISFSQGLGIRYTQNKLLFELGLESLHFSDNAFVVNQSTGSRAFPRKGNSYELNYITIGAGIRTSVFRGLYLDNSLHFGVPISKNVSSPDPIQSSLIITANQSGKGGILNFQTFLHNRLFYQYPASDQVLLSMGLVLQTNFNPIVDEDVPSELFWSNKTVNVHNQLGMSFTISYLFGSK
jgi:hypothetical protein